MPLETIIFLFGSFLFRFLFLRFLLLRLLLYLDRLALAPLAFLLLFFSFFGFFFFGSSIGAVFFFYHRFTILLSFLFFLHFHRNGLSFLRSLFGLRWYLDFFPWRIRCTRRRSIFVQIVWHIDFIIVLSESIYKSKCLVVAARNESDLSNFGFSAICFFEMIELKSELEECTRSRLSSSPK